MTIEKKIRRSGAVVLGMDEIEEILARLPVKHTLRCKLLSKSYLNLIKTPSFINKHLRYHQSDHHIAIIIMCKNLHNIAFNRLVSVSVLDAESKVLFTPPPSFSTASTLPVGSCNGLLVVRVRQNEQDLTVFNPATRDYLKLPLPNLAHVTGRLFLDALGFGYDAKSGDYKLVKIGDYSREGNNGPCFYMTEIWTMKSNSWKLINPPMPSLFLEKEYMIRPFYGLLVNRILYWLAYAKDENDWDAVILSFDPTTDTFIQIVLPNVARRRRDKFDLNLIDFSGSLALSIGLPSGESDTLFDIWVMGTSTDSSSSSLWTNRFPIGPFPLHVRITRVCVNGKFVLQRVAQHHSSFTESSLILYDPHHKKIVKETAVPEFQVATTVWSHTESLIKPE